MKLFNLFKKQEQRNNNIEYTVAYSDALNFGSLSTNTNALNISAVYRAVDLISDSIAVLPLNVKLRDKKHKDIIANHPIYTAFNNGVISKYTLIKLLVQSVIIKGNGFAYIERAKDGTVIGLKFLPNETVIVNYNQQTDTLYYTSSLISGNVIEPCNMIHLVKNTNDGINGIGVLKYAKNTISLARNTEESANNFFQSGCNLSGVLKVEGPVSDKQKQEIRSSWNQAYSNGGNGLAVLQGNMSYQPIQLSASDSQMLESRQYNLQDIARFFGISPVLLGDLTHSSYSTLEAVQNQFLLHTLQPYISMIEEEFKRKLLLPNEQDLDINLDETYLLKTDKSALASYYSTLLDKGILCVNEVRSELGYSEIEGGDKHIIPYTSIDDNVINNTKNDTGNESK